MIKFFLPLIIILSTGTIAYSQPVYPYQDIKLEKPSDYIATESMALSAANFLLTTPFMEVNAGRTTALTFLYKWIEGAKNHQFYLNGIAAELGDDRDLLSLYIAAMAKYTLENKNRPPVALEVEPNAAKLVLAYCDDPKNNFKLRKKYRKIFEKN